MASPRTGLASKLYFPFCSYMDGVGRNGGLLLRGVGRGLASP